MDLMKALRLSVLRGREQALHNRIAGGYAKGDYAAELRRKQNEVRAEIRRLEAEG